MPSRIMVHNSAKTVYPLPDNSTLQEAGELLSLPLACFHRCPGIELRYSINTILELCKDYHIFLPA
jgi:hypothetical protein